jgi:hypothetical protein
MVASPDLTLSRITGSVARAILFHSPGTLLDHVTGGILGLGSGPGHGHRLVTGRLMKPGLRPDLLHDLIAGSVLELSANLLLQEEHAAGVGNSSPLLCLHQLTGAIAGTIRVRCWTVPATGGHSYGRGAEHQSCRDSHHC